MGRPKKTDTTVKRGRGRPAKDTHKCLRCGEIKPADNFYVIAGDFYNDRGRSPVCKECIEVLYENYIEKYKHRGFINCEKKAIERICMGVDQYFSMKVFDSVMGKKQDPRSADTSLIALYFKYANLSVNAKKSYDDTVEEKFMHSIEEHHVNITEDGDLESDENINRAMKVFGSGFEREDYKFLIEQYDDWTARHECQTKSQEEIFKRICFTQLDLHKAQKMHGDTKHLNDTLIKQLDAAKLQPKQNNNEAVSDAQTFGTLIDKWENEKPIPDVDESLKDVDKIGFYIDVFFRGHLAKMVGLNNALSKRYDEYMSQYTVDKPEYLDDEDNEALFDAVFGKAMAEEE